MKPLRDLLRQHRALFAVPMAARGRSGIDSIAPVATPVHRNAGQTHDPQSETLLEIACPDSTSEDIARERHVRDGQHLARQEQWENLAIRIHAADLAREVTPGGMPTAELMAYGARADVVMAVEHALIDPRPARDAPLLDGIEALEHVLAEHPTCHVVAAIVAQAHMDIGWAWRGTDGQAQVTELSRLVFEAHFGRAAEILRPFDNAALKSPLLAATCCALLGNSAEGQSPISDRYEELIDLNPANRRPLRAMGVHLLPRWYGSYEELELEARRTCARLLGTWGAGGYAWVMFDAIVHDDHACAKLDLPFFIEGLQDILARAPDAYTVNLLAAYCANATPDAPEANNAANLNRAAIADCARWIVRDHLTELHPMVWAHAAQGFDNNLRVRSADRFAAAGRADAMRIITRLFSREIAAGKRIVFTDTGPETEALAG